MAVVSDQYSLWLWSVISIPYGCGSDQYSLWLWSVISIPYGCGQ